MFEGFPKRIIYFVNRNINPEKALKNIAFYDLIVHDLIL